MRLYIPNLVTSTQTLLLLGSGAREHALAEKLTRDGATVLVLPGNAGIPNSHSEIDPLDFDEADGVTEAEREVLGTDHCEIGAWYAEENHLPSELREVMLAHHGDQPATINPRLVALTMASDHLANYVQRHAPTTEYPFRENPGLQRLEELGSSGAVERVGELCESLLTDLIHQSLDMSKPLHPGQFQRG